MRPALAFALLCFALPRPAAGFVFFEHAWFSDTGCALAQTRLQSALAQPEPRDPRRRRVQVARALALALVCPERTPARYCADGQKRVQSQVNRLDGDLGDYAVTFGDFSGLGDHYSLLGPVQGLPRAGEDGLIRELWTWMAEDPGDPGGVVSDVGEEACDHEVRVPWVQAHADVERHQARLGRGDDRGLPHAALSARRRTRPAPGPTDPDALFTFDNPHFLDLQLSNHIHFGAAAYQTWLGLHAAAVDVSGARCADVLGLDADALEDLDPGESVDWHGLSLSARRAAGCALLRGFVRARLERWAERAPPPAASPLAAFVERLRAAPDAPDVEAQLDRVVAALHGVVLEGFGLHFLQDGLAGGHVRTDRTARGLADSRHTHDLDGDEGVAVSVRTRAGLRRLVAFGDGRLFGPELARPVSCDAAFARGGRAAVTTCLLRYQRGVITTTVAASVVDWVLGGTLYDRATPSDAPQPGCAHLRPIEAFVCRALPVEAPSVGPGLDAPTDAHLSVAALPVPPPPFDYEALLASTGLDLSGGAPQLGARLVLLTEIGRWADWMRSHQIAVTGTLGEGRDARLDLEYGHAFHWRWAARFLVDAGGFVFLGASHLDDDAAVTYGVGPAAGLTFLPEGWTKIPLQFSFGYRLPFQLGDSRGGEARVVGHLFEIALGLAFM